jgi:regulator of replication initiation timing
LVSIFDCGFIITDLDFLKEMSQHIFGIDSFVDSEELMSWLLLNPEFDLLTGTNSNFPLLDPLNSQSSTAAADQQDYPVPNYQIPATSEAGYDNEFIHQSQDINLFPPTTDFPSPPKVKKEPTKTKFTTLREPEKKPASKLPRKRPRESLDDLEERVKELRKENSDLQAHLLNVTQRTTEVQKQRVSMERLMASKLSEAQGKDDSETELSEIVKQYTDLYADYGKCRQREVCLSCTFFVKSPFTFSLS